MLDRLPAALSRYTHVNNLRAKIEPDPSTPRFIVGVRGLGYRFDG